MAREINLVPDIKNDMIKALKLRNFIFFLCIVIASAAAGAVAIVGSIAGGQQAAVNGKKATLDEMTKTISSYSDLSEFLTVKDQLGNIANITSNKTLLSRTFGILSALIPTGADRITISELNINLSGDAPTFNFDAQANAGEPPYIDYNVLDSFKKSMSYMRYDYGSYVDKEGATIPAYCMIENGPDGATLYDVDRGYYAYWLITGDGCHPSFEEEDEDDSTDSSTSSDTNSSDNSSTSSNSDNNSNSSSTESDSDKAAARLAKLTAGYTTEDYNGQTVVRIWRTPQFNDWYQSTTASTNSSTSTNSANTNSSSSSNSTTSTAAKPSISLDGQIENVAHFNSECITYSGEEDDKGNVTWSTENESCLLIPDGSDGIRISDSSNGRSSGDELVLRFTATISLAPEVYKFTNTHMLALAPAGRYNVTDSYVQIQSIFGERAADCAADDLTCKGSN